MWKWTDGASKRGSLGLGLVWFASHHEVGLVVGVRCSTVLYWIVRFMSTTASHRCIHVQIELSFGEETMGWNGMEAKCSSSAGTKLLVRPLAVV